MDYYKLLDGEKAIVVRRQGKNISGSYCHYVMASIAIQTTGGKKVYMPKGNGHSPYWINGTGNFVAHYRTGMNKADFARYQGLVGQLMAIADEINQSGYFERKHQHHGK